MPTVVEPGATDRLPVTAREDRGIPGEARVCPILRTVLDAHGRDRAEVRLVLLARLAAPLPA
ncbi:hypothetical protein FHS29_003026 [Saccharothrix tamanrassetensis]|uniref:Uncharacterized protein n=1 Tax=Saccharothrix tamanrassetensis TaxID=1051531 RepID=A0A841CHH8_9PSEU|nr:hypothetical protein [Saccharothrix tamanrassetensis]MBB5956440.1 hypothetical protein [Saccharothrix tamanrassetensis]